jgi:sarcosine oxidase
MNQYDFIIVGLGTVGSATCMELARRGHSVLGLDTLHPPHNLGSHHGESRSIRRAYLEGTSYVPMALKSWESWQKLERDAKTTLLATTGNLTIGPPDCPAVAGFLKSAKYYGITHQELTAADVSKKWPQLSLPANFVAGLEVEAGLLFPELCISILLSEAEKTGAALKFNERADSWKDDGDRVTVYTPRGRYEAGRLLLAAGARNKKLVGHIGTWLLPKRVPVHWIDPPDSMSFKLGVLPVNFWQLPSRDVTGKFQYREFYSIPITHHAGRVKVAAHNCLKDCDPDDLKMKVSTKEARSVKNFMNNHLPSLENCAFYANICFYTLTPDGDFSLGPLPGYDNVFLAALAGHGFKFAPVLGEILADMLEGSMPAYDVAMFSPGRF